MEKVTLERSISTGEMFTPFKKKRFSDQIADLIQKKILEEGLAIGSSLPTEKELAGTFEVSRPVIREALRILEMSGLVSIKRGATGGIFVANLFSRPIKRSLNNLIVSGEVTVDHLFEARLLIEPYIAKEATLSATEEDIGAFRELLENSASHFDDAAHLKENNLRFHLLIAKTSRNPVLSIMLESVFELLMERSLDFQDLSLERKFFEIHKGIFDVIVEEKADEASRLVREDIMSVMRTLRKFRESSSQE